MAGSGESDGGSADEQAGRALLGSGEETPLAHSSGIGLWLINRLTDHLNGQIT